MRTIASSIAIALMALAACTSSEPPRVGPTPAVLPPVFPPPGALVDDRTVASVALPPEEPGASAPKTPDLAPTAPSTEPGPLTVSIDSGTLMYPSTKYADAPIWLRTSRPVTAEALIDAVELIGAPSKEDLVAWRTTRVGLTLEASQDDATIWFLRPETRFQVGHWYRLRVAPSLRSGETPPLGQEIVSYFRGPEPLRVNGVSCGWPACTREDRWTVSFNGQVDAATLAGCVRTVPALDLGKVSVEGWSIVFHPKNTRVGQAYRVLVGGTCKSVDGDPLRTPFEATIKVETPRARLSLARGTGYIAPAVGAGPPAIKVGAAYTGALTVGLTRLTRETLPAFLAKNLESWGGLSFADAEVAKSATISPRGVDAGHVDVPISLAPALGDSDRGLVYLRVEAEHIGDSDEPPLRQALVQVTELGVSAKSGPEDTLVWVTSLIDHTPLSGVQIAALDDQGKTVWTATTDARGLATGPGRRDATGEGSQVRVLMASRGEDLAFLDLAEYANRTEPYEFGLDQAWNAEAHGLRGIVFTERGVYRAGETVHIKALLRVERSGRLDPVRSRTVALTITNPLGDRILARDVELGAVGDLELDLPLPEAASLGTYRIETAVTDEASGHLAGSFRVEAYRPNTFEVQVGELVRTLVPTEEGTRVDAIRGEATGRYYYGAAMADAGARWWVHREDAAFTPAAYPGFTFEVPRWSYDTWEPEGTSVEAIASGEGVLDADGRLVIEAPIDALAESLVKGPQTLRLEVEVTDVDEQTVTGRGSVRIESADHYLGVRASKSFVGVGEEVGVEAIALTPDGAAVTGKAFELRFIQRTWESEWVTVAGGGRTWRSEVREDVLSRQRMTSAAEPVKASFAPPRSGLYWIEVEGKDDQGRAVKARESVWVWGEGASWAGNDQGHVDLVPAQERWKVGETARFVVQSPFLRAQALVTVEVNGVVWRDVRVLEGTAPLLEVPVSDAMMPNAFVSLVMVGVPPGGGPDAEAEVRIGYERIEVDTAERRVAVTVTPDAPRHAPGEPVRVRVELGDAEGRPVAGQVTFMAVDEGVLSLTGYRTPDPHKAFYRPRSLAVVTSEARKQLWSKLVADDGMKSDWGGGGEGGEATNYRAAFATTAAFFPDVVVGPDGKAEVSFDLPDNLTTFRLMAVAATVDGRFGQGESEVEVAKPLLVRPGLPRFLSVGDRVDARAVVQALDPELSGEVVVTAAVSGPVRIEGEDEARIAASAKATPVVFDVRATEPGLATFAFTVSGRRGATPVSDAVQIQVPVLWPAATRSAIASGLIAPSDDASATSLQIPDWVRDDIGGVTVTLTSTRLGELLPGLDYLLEYPYGCVEQTTGGTLPLLALSELQSGFSLPGITPEQVRVRAQAGLDRLRTMQTWSGGMGYWPGDTAPHPWGSVYAGMALVRASRIAGLEVPASSIERLSSYLRDMLRDQAASAREEWHSEIEVVKPFAAWVLAQAGTPEPAYHAAIFAERDKLPDFGKLLLALAISESHGDATMAATLLDEVIATVRVDGARARIERQADAYYWSSTMDSDVRSMALLAMALEAIRPGDPLLAKVQQGLLDERESGRWMSTQDNAFAILALAGTFLATERAGARFTASVEVDGQVWLSEAMSSDDPAPKTLHLPMYLARKASGKELVIKREGDDAPVYFTLRFDYAPAQVPDKPLTQGFEITRRYRIATGPRAGQEATELEPGDLVRVDVAVRTVEDRRYVAVDDPLPAGLEPVTLDFDTTRSSLAALVGEEPRQWWRPTIFNFKEQKDDRVLAFADVMPAGTHTFTYLARATSAGSFMAPSARVHEMYHPGVFGQSQATRVAVR